MRRRQILFPMAQLMHSSLAARGIKWSLCMVHTLDCANLVSVHPLMYQNELGK